jgi:hypothetical protein
MRRQIVGILLAACVGPAIAVSTSLPRADASPDGASLADILERNAQARGGLHAWRAVRTLVWAGHVETAATKGQRLPFLLEMQRPNQTRFEIRTVGGRFTRIFDGTKGWRLRPGGDGVPESKALSQAEVDYAREEFVIDGPLLDHQSKGVSVKLEGADLLDGRRAYRLSLKLPSGAERRLWIDAETYLDVRYDRPSNSPLKPGATVSVYYRDYAAVDGGLRVPTRLESGPTVGLQSVERPDVLVIDRVVVNPKLDQRAFAKPAVPWQHRALVNIPNEQVSPGMRTAAPPAR